jgi:hypothetical protein
MIQRKPYNGFENARNVTPQDINDIIMRGFKKHTRVVVRDLAHYI